MYRDYITSELTIKNSAYLNIYLNSRRIVNNKIDYLRHSNRQTLQPNFTFQTNYLRFKFLLFKRNEFCETPKRITFTEKKKKNIFRNCERSIKVEGTPITSQSNNRSRQWQANMPVSMPIATQVTIFFFLSSPPPSSSLSRSAPVFTLQALVNNQLVLFVNYNLAVYTGTELKFYDPTMLIGLPD